MKHAGVRVDADAAPHARRRPRPRGLARPPRPGGARARWRGRPPAPRQGRRHRAPPLTLEHHRSAAALDATEWDALLGERGTFTVDGLQFLERAFAGGERPEDEWDFHYYVVRNREGKAVLATFFTAALWKDDMMASAEVSELVEQRRAEDPYYLTSMTFAMGSLLTEGDHLYLDRNADWKGALDLLMPAVSEHAKAAGAGTIVLRDLLLRRPRAGRGRARARLRQDLAAGLARLRAGRRRRRAVARAPVLEGARAPAQGRAAVRRRLRHRVPDLRRARGQRRRARAPLRALPRGAGARARPQLVPAAAHVPARDARAPVAGS